MKRLPLERSFGAALAAVVLAACGAAGGNTLGQSPAAATPAVVATTAASPSRTQSPLPAPCPSPSSAPSSSQSPSPAPADVRLVIDDFNASEVRLARLNATDTATVPGHFVAVVNHQVIVLNGSKLEAVDPNGKVTRLGQLAAAIDGNGVGTVAVNPALSQWIYTLRDDKLTSYIHVGTSTCDAVIASLASPDGNSYYQTFAWNPSGIYMLREPVGLGGAGPFLEYDFPLVRFDLTSGRMTDVSPQCIVHEVLDDGTLICGQNSAGGRVEVRSPSGHSNEIQLATGGGNTGQAYKTVAVSPDNKRLIAVRNGSKDPVINYQMAVAGLASSTAQAFGPLDYIFDAWLPDGRVLADHFCANPGWGGGPCDAKLDGTYIFSADGTSHTLFFKLTHGAVVGYV
jgi:hypothetical protein